MGTIARYEIVVVGGGIAGVSLGARLASTRRVLVLEREAHLGSHATGRSAALYAPAYGAGPIRVLTQASKPAFATADNEEDPTPLLRARATLLIATQAQRAALSRTYAEDPSLFERLGTRDVERLVPIFRPGAVEAALFESSSADIDVDALLQREVRRFVRGGGEFRTAEPLLALAPADGGWRLTVASGEIQAGLVVNAAGAWADEVAELAGVSPIGLSPRRRTAALVDAPLVEGFADWPAVIDIEERFYFKPDAGKLLVSPAEETPVPPHDAYADDEALAEGIDRIAQLTTLEVRRAPRRWAGLRTFAPDRIPVIGFDAARSGFFWMAGQGGYGIQTAPAAADLAAALIAGQPPPAYADAALVQSLSPARFWRGDARH